LGTIPDSPLGKAARFPEAYDAGLLYPVERAPQRDALGLRGAPPFEGVDRWTAWEACWLDEQSRPRVAVATFAVPSTSPRLVESKSVKLWLASLGHVRFASADEFAATLRRDLSAATGADVSASVHLPVDWTRALARREPAGEAIDDATPVAMPDAPDAALLDCTGGHADETLLMRAFRSVCPVTGQPDMAEVAIAYRGPRIARAALYAYLLGFRRHPGFHEHCVERIFVDVDRACRPESLRVEARFARRGGVDINPLRSRGMTGGALAPTLRQ
jgi:7-cyano-7-deazaguanine reductase